MEKSNLVKERAKKAAIIIGIATFAGFSGILFIPQVYMMGFFTPYVIFAQLMFLTPIGLLEAVIVAWAFYFIFKHIRKKLFYTILLIIGVIICFILGFFSNVRLFQFATKQPPYMSKIDTNGDGRIDKWVYDDNLNTRVELDTNYDGEPDIKEYYKNGKFIKKEVKVGSEWKIELP